MLLEKNRISKRNNDFSPLICCFFIALAKPFSLWKWTKIGFPPLGVRSCRAAAARKRARRRRFARSRRTPARAARRGSCERKTTLRHMK